MNCEPRTAFRGYWTGHRYRSCMLVTRYGKQRHRTEKIALDTSGRAMGGCRGVSRVVRQGVVRS
jgi:hypothetical protein